MKKIAEIFSLVFLIFLSGCYFHSDLTKEFPNNFWPEILKPKNDKYVDLSGVYKVTIYKENIIEENTYEEYIRDKKYEADYKNSTRFPPGLHTIVGSEFKVKQYGDNKIEIIFRNRSNIMEENIITKSNNELKWNNQKNMFEYKVTTYTPGGMGGGLFLFNDHTASFGKGIDNSFLCEEYNYFKVIGYFVIIFYQESKYNQKYKFQFIRELNKEDEMLFTQNIPITPDKNINKN